MSLNFLLAKLSAIRIMLGIRSVCNMKIPINGSLFTIKEIDGPLSRNGQEFPVSVRYAAREILLLRSLPETIKIQVLAAALSEACMKHRIPLIWPKWDQST
jgi:hypothetical protein